MFRGMEYVYAIWKEHGFSNAAKKLYMSQPALSNSVKRIEDKLGFLIFDRSTSPIQLTEVGKEYLRAVEQMMAIQENFSHYLADTQDLKIGRITIGSGAMFSSYLLPELVARYKEHYPYVEINIIESGKDNLESMLLDGTIDLVMESRSFPESLVERWPFQREHIVLAVPRAWSVNGELVAWQQSIDNIISGSYLGQRYPAVPLEKFRDCPFLLQSPGDENYDRALSLCRSHGFTPHAILTLSQQLTSYNMVCAGLGAAFVSDTLVKSTLPNPNVVYYKLEGDVTKREICFYRKRNRYMSRCVRLFLQEACPEDFNIA